MKFGQNWSNIYLIREFLKVGGKTVIPVCELSISEFELIERLQSITKDNSQQKEKKSNVK